MSIHITSTLTLAQKSQLFNLWNNEYPESLAYNSPEEFNEYFDTLPQAQHHLMLASNGTIQAWGFSFMHHKQTCFAIIINQNQQKTGKGTQIINSLKNNNPQLYGFVINNSLQYKRNGSHYQTPMPFYHKMGFAQCPNPETDNTSTIKIKWERSSKEN
jgi:hypothetical protein